MSSELKQSDVGTYLNATARTTLDLLADARSKSTIYPQMGTGAHAKFSGALVVEVALHKAFDRREPIAIIGDTHKVGLSFIEKCTYVFDEFKSQSFMDIVNRLSPGETIPIGVAMILLRKTAVGVRAVGSFELSEEGGAPTDVAYTTGTFSEVVVVSHHGIYPTPADAWVPGQSVFYDYTTGRTVKNYKGWKLQ